MIDSYYEKWAKPYIDEIVKSGPMHEKAFNYCKKLAERDITTDKELLKTMSYKIYNELKNYLSINDADKKCNEIINIIRLHSNRKNEFVKQLIHKEIEQQQQYYERSGMSLGM
jgi:hypothetical protein